MASVLKPLLLGQTGKVTHLAPHQGKMTANATEICFTRSVVTLPNSEPTPASLLVCMKVGDCLHYDAKLRVNPVTQDIIYYATKVWFPNSKNTKTGEESSSRQSPVSPVQSTAKMLRKSIVKVLRDKGPRTVEQLHSELRTSSSELQKVYGNSPEGLRTFVAYHKNHFLPVDGQVRLLKGGKPLVQKCIQSIKTLLRPLGSASVHLIFELLQNCDQDVRNFIFSSKALFSFLETHPEFFVILPDGTVSVIEKGNDKADGDIPQKAKSPKATTEERKLSNVLQCLASLLNDKKRVPLYKLFQELKESSPDALQVVGTKPIDLLNLLVRCPGTFVVHENQMVQLIKNENRNGASPKAGKVPKTADHGMSAKNVKAILKAKGPLTVDQLMASKEFCEQIGGTRDALVSFLNSKKSFHITEDGTVVYGKQKRSNSLEQNSLPRHYCGSIQSIGLQFGFIRHGINSSDNIFFDADSYMEPMKDLKSALEQGDQVECLFHNNQPGKRNKYRAVAVWKTILKDAIPGDTLSELLALPTVLTSPVHYGEAVVTYFAGDIGYCYPHGGSDTDSLIEFEEGDKTQPALITFHFGRMWGQQEQLALRAHLKKGARVMFLAHLCPAAKDSAFPVHWRAISLWLPTKSIYDADPSNLISVTAELQELSTEGGRLSFGKDPWAHSIIFYWKQIMSRADGLLDKAVYAKVGHTFWCIVTSGKMTKDTSRWVAVELYPCNHDMASSPPVKYMSCPAMPLPQTHLFSDPVTKPMNVEETRSKSSNSKSHPGQTTEQRDCDVDLLLDLGPADDASNASGVVKDGAVHEADNQTIVDGTGKMVSKDNYEGILETDSGDVLKFTAHAFFYNGRPVSHLAFPVGTQVHFDGRYTEGGEMYAETIWIGKKPLPGRVTSFPQ